MRSIAPVVAILWLTAVSIAVSHRAEAKPPPVVEVAKKPARPTKVDEVDALRLRLVVSQANEQVAIRQAALERADVAEKRHQALQEEYRAVLALFERKYGIKPDAGDSFDVQTLVIQWADDKKKGGAK